ncbi:MAG: hypothetical protein NTV98_02395 [Candidatus Roizmanbacteria bacterium]|nr:hypothetical protein [Candidatus Roizmanbacteria bacterium]
MKKLALALFIIGCLLLLYSTQIPDKKINAKVIFINQVRGNECCQKGLLEFTKRQLELFKKLSLPSTFVLRYDVLKNKQYLSLLKSYANNNINYGIFFEITPSLAKDAGVVYKGTEERWYRAQYAYLVGYSQDERIKIIDTAMALFKAEFGVYPKTTAGWMIDTYSAEHLSKTYGVENHEITREQWGTDGYALYGGSVLSVYAPSKNWIFMPGSSEENLLPLRIVRQTLSDPVHNYGDLTSGYTSQPNDYGRTKSFDYFKYLLKQVEGYSQPVAVLGLENSLDKKYQDIYEGQVAYVSNVISRQNIIFPSAITEIRDVNYVVGTDFSNTSYKSYWIETNYYRARFILKNNYLQLTDLRVFDKTIFDPYYAFPSGEKTAYWEIPYVFDSSQNGMHKKINTISTKTGELFRFFGNEDWIRERTNPVVNEQFLQEINGILFPQIKEGTQPFISEKDGVVILSYTQKDGNNIQFTFFDNHFFAKGIHNNDYEIKGQFGKGTDLKQEQTNDGELFTPTLSVAALTKNGAVSNNQGIVDEKDINVTIIYNASSSLIGRNPARIVVVSKDSGGNPARINNIKISHANGSFDSVKIHETEGHLGEFDGMYYVDIEQKNAGTYTPILSYNFQHKTLLPLSFIFDCKKDIKSCLLSPQKLFNYLKVKVEDILNRR